MKTRPGPILILVVILVGIHAHGWAQGGLGPLPQPLTSQAAVDYALTHNRAYRAAMEDVAAADQKVRQAQADFFPRVDGSYAFTQLSDQPVIILGGQQGIPFSLKRSNRWQIDVVQPLFAGFGLESAYRVSEAGRQITEYQREEARLNLTRDVRAIHLQVLLAHRLLGVAQDNVISLEVQRQNAEAGYQQGVAAPNDVMKANVALSEAVQHERSVAKQLTILRSNLNQLLDIDLHAKVELMDIEEKTYSIPDLHQLYTQAEKKRPEYLATLMAIKQTEYGKTSARSRYYPKISAFAQYYREGEDLSGDTNPFTNNDNAAVGVRMDWNLFEGGKTRASELEWEHRRRGLEQRRDDLREKIRLQVENAYEQLNLAFANIETTRAALEQAKENERITTLQYKEQLVIFLEVLNAQVFLAQSRADFFQALYGYEIAKAELDRAIGEP